MVLKHTDGPSCPSCEHKLIDVNNELVNWFNWVKTNHQSVHVSWGYRGKIEQDEAYASGHSKLQYPQSKHNHKDSLNEPDSLAVDLFEQIDHKAVFDPIKMAKINDESSLASYKLRWGGEFKTSGDSGHFELTTI